MLVRETNSIYPPLEAVDKLINTIAGTELAFEQLNKSIRSLEDQIFELDKEDANMLSAYYEGLDPKLVKLVNDNYCRWETILETNFSQSFLEGGVKSISAYPLYDRFKNLITKELSIISAFKFENLLFIGSGPFPITAILLHQLTGKKVDCLEREQCAADISNAILEKLGFSEMIKVYVGDGCTFDVCKYDVVLKALLAKPKQGILKNIRSMNDRALVLCRTSFGLRQLVYEGAPSRSLHGYIAVNHQLASYNDTISTLLLISKKQFTDSVNLQWLNKLGDKEKLKLIEMMNLVISRDNNNGFLTPIDEDHPYIQVLERDISLGIKHLLVIESEDKYLGQLIINHSYVDTYKHRAEISTLMLDESVRGKEISLLITHKLIEKCLALDIRFLTLTVRAGSAVELLWKYMGFETYGHLPCYSQVNDQKYAGVYMYKDVDTLRDSLLRKLESMYR